SRILRSEELRLELALERQPGLERDLGPGLHRALDVPDGQRGLLRRAVAARELEHLCQELRLVRRVQDATHEPEALGRLVIEELAVRHQLDRLRLADRAREALRTARARQDAERDLGQAALARALAREAQVGRERDLEPAADTVTAERRDDELGRVLETQQRLV